MAARGSSVPSSGACRRRAARIARRPPRSRAADRPPPRLPCRRPTADRHAVAPTSSLALSAASRPSGEVNTIGPTPPHARDIGSQPHAANEMRARNVSRPVGAARREIDNGGLGAPLAQRRNRPSLDARQRVSPRSTERQFPNLISRRHAVGEHGRLHPSARARTRPCGRARRRHRKERCARRAPRSIRPSPARAHRPACLRTRAGSSEELFRRAHVAEVKRALVPLGAPAFKGGAIEHRHADALRPAGGGGLGPCRPSTESSPNVRV